MLLYLIRRSAFALLFVLQGLTRRELPELARMALPFFALLVLSVLMIYLFPQIVLIGPSLM